MSDDELPEVQTTKCDHCGVDVPLPANYFGFNDEGEEVAICYKCFCFYLDGFDNPKGWDE